VIRKEPGGCGGLVELRPAELHATSTTSDAVSAFMLASRFESDGASVVP
jgi:hypothetical protein